MSERLFPTWDRTPTERAEMRARSARAALRLFDLDPDAKPMCAVCASLEHGTDACPSGAEALRLDL